LRRGAATAKISDLSGRGAPLRVDATLAGNPVTKRLRAGSREELIRRNNVNATGNGRYWAPPSDKIRLQMLAGAGND